MPRSLAADNRRALESRLRELGPGIRREIDSTLSTAADGQAREGEDERRPVSIDVVLDHLLRQIGEGREGAETPRLADQLSRQVRGAATSGVDLGATLRRMVVVSAVLGEFVSNEIRDLPQPARHSLQREQSLHLDHTLAAVAEVYRSVACDQAAHSIAERVERVLAGDTSALRGLDLEVDGWNLGAIAHGSGANEAVLSLAENRNLRFLTVRRESGLVWAWLAAHDRAALLEFTRDAGGRLPPGISVALGEIHRGLEGWRLTHREARAAIGVMLQRPGRVTRSSDVAPLAALLGDDVLAELMRDTYLRPLRRADPGARIRRTLRAYVDTSLNAASTSAILGIDRSTVQRHLQRAEDHLGRRLNSCFAELKLALELEELEQLESIE